MPVYLATNMMLLRAVGAWNDYPEGSWSRRAYYFLTAFVIVAFILHLVTQFAFPFSHIDDVGEATEGFNLTTVYMVTFLKMLMLLIRREALSKVLEGLELHVGDHWGDEVEILENGDDYAERLTKNFSLLTALGTIFFFLNAGLTVAPTMASCASRNLTEDVCKDPERNLIYPAEFPFDTDGDSLGHAGALVFQVVGPGLFGNAVNLAADMLLVSLLIHLRARFRALCYLLRELDSRALDNGAVAVPSLELHEDEELRYSLLAEYIRHHQELYRLSADVNHIFSPLLFMQCFFSSVSYCIILFHLTMVSDDTVHLVKNVLFLMTHMGQLLLFCWYGTQIFEESLSVMHAAYDTSWLRSSARFKIAVSAIICRAQRPVLLSGLNVYQVTLETFTSMLSSAFSYYTVLRKMYADGFF